MKPSKITYHYRVDGVVVAQQMGNGLRRVEAVEAEVTDYLDGRYYVMLSGSSIRRDGGVGPWRSAGWTIGGRWDASYEAAPFVFELLAATREARAL